ncbi:hypothetical protein [Kribbella sp. C-35]|uniref:hypothetical protein n=1 Tax=Kribbella sp. C-35 TaxID=2789276 RepID=UPI0039788646
MYSLPVHRLCPKRDHRLVIERIVQVVWLPFRGDDRGGEDDSSAAGANGPGAGR